MTLHLLPRCLAAATLERRPFWWRLIDAIEAIQRRRAEQVIRAHLRRHRGEPHNGFTRELERRFLGQ